MKPEIATAIVTVGDGGRGFVVAGEWIKVVITCAHCLPRPPPAHGAAYLREKTYENLLGRLGETPTVWVECLFADPVSDIAVLGSPDNQALGNEADAYEELLEPIKPLAISDTKERAAPGSSRWRANGFRAPMKSLTTVHFGFLLKRSNSI